ncbi:acylphosphatase [Chlorobium sp. BLA1]|uniref:acylphosphatase n=1 Tax=Candidatus Chlorobium masyuteum TaxID=2716876 RepID=UPI00141FA73E|nr:acylphosphatase [Candidatus Chlorobium masyuteum]NHQ59562.1 acylphosphatase [Candidatus Chlorobium masyuteum]NTU45811.1 acylphosphatase [Chlorobiaceae bacterium]
MQKRMHLTVSGLVQGVGFRMFIDRVANELNLHGWVKNRPDGTVEIEAQGAEEKLDELFRRAEKGPSRARVTGIKRMEMAPDHSFCGFTVLL